MKLEIANKTYEEVKQMLNDRGSCAMIRPTGFGKTYLMVKLAQEYKKVLFLYPRNIIKIATLKKYEKKLDKSKIQFVSYQKIVKLSYKSSDFKAFFSDIDLIICDEAHMMGADKTSQAIHKLFDSFPNAHKLGGTATPDRSDGIDIIDDFFNDNTISKYGINEAIDDGIIQRPHYVQALYEIDKAFARLKEKVQNLVSDKKTRDEMMDEISAKEMEYSTVLNAPEVIRTHITEIRGNLSYMKFIVFFSEKTALFEKSIEVRDWFHIAFPHMDIQEITVISENEYARNIHRLENYKHRENTIDLIYCIDMLNMGYHISDLTGIIMRRGTNSDIIYKQQIGRCLSVESKEIPIIFDFVNNWERDAYFINHLENLNQKDVSDIQKGKRSYEIDELHVVAHGNVKNAREFALRMEDKIEKLKLEKAVWFYQYRSTPINVLVKMTGIRKDKLREHFISLNMEIDD